MEQQILFLINRQWTNSILDWFMAVMSDFSLWIPFLILAGAGLLIFGGFRARALVVGLLIGVGFCEGIVGPLKEMVGRPRPHEMYADVRMVSLRHLSPRVLALFKEPRVRLSRPKLGERRGASFPSAHTANNFCVAIILAGFYRKRGWLYFFPAALVGYSRIYTGSHWPSDVFISTLIGMGVGLLCLAGYEFFWRYVGPYVLPRVMRDHPNLIQGVSE